MKKQVATFAHGVEIAQPPHLAAQCPVRKRQDGLASAPYVVSGGPIAVLGNETARRIYLGAREAAVEADRHDAARPQQRQENAPAPQRVGEVMQHAARLDQVEAASD